MFTFFQDLKSGLRQFAHNPFFATMVVVTLGLGFGPNCFIYTVVDSFYFKPLPYKNQDRLVLLNQSNLKNTDLEGVSLYTLQVWQKNAKSFEKLAGYQRAGFNINLEGRPERFSGQLTTEDFFQVLGMTPALGRAFQAGDSTAGVNQVVVISDGLWRDYFFRRPDIIGLTLRMNGMPTTVIGVMPPEFQSFIEGRSARLWAPISLEKGVSPQDLPAVNAIALLKAGRSIEQTRAELGSLDVVLAGQFPDSYRDQKTSVRDFRSSLFEGLGPPIKMLWVMVVLVLLIACGNAANLLLGRAMCRTKEIGVRTALGAGRMRLVRQMLTESLLFSGAGALLGLLLAYWGIELIWAHTAPMFQAIGVEKFQIDRRILLFTCLLSLFTPLLFGAVPAFRGSRVDINGSLKEGSIGNSAGRSRNRLGRALVAAQIALCTATLIGTALMIKSFLHFAEVTANPGFQPQNLLVATIPQPGGITPPSNARLDFLQELETKISAVPGVSTVALTNRLPFLDTGTSAVLVKRAAGAQSEGQSDSSLKVESRLVNPDFFATLSIPLLKGRFFTSQDNQNNLPVAIIGENLAKAGWGEADPVGESVLLEGKWRTIVGIAGSTLKTSPFRFRSATREIYLPYLQAAPADMKLLVQRADASLSLGPVLRQQVSLLDADQPLVDLQPMEQALGGFLAPFQLILLLMSLFGAIALLLAAGGLYGVIVLFVSQRTREIGIRKALGAPDPQIMKMILKQGLRLIVIGLVPGLLLGMALAKVLPAEILGVGSLSPFYFLGAVLILSLVSLSACLLPARRAARVDPVQALRCE